MQTHPKWKHSANGCVLVQDEAEEAALGEGWYDFIEQVPADAPATDVEMLRATAESLGLKVDKRWSAQRLEDEIKAKIEAGGEGHDDSLV